MAPRRDIAAVPTPWNALYPTSNVSSDGGTVHGVNARCRVVPDVLSNLFIRVCGFKGIPRGPNKPFPGPGGGKSLSKFDGCDHRFDIKAGGQEVWIDDRRIEWICAPEFDLSTCQIWYERSNDLMKRMRHIREVGEMRLVEIDIHPPSGLDSGAAQPLNQMNWKWAEVGPGEGSP